MSIFSIFKDFDYKGLKINRDAQTYNKKFLKKIFELGAYSFYKDTRGVIHIHERIDDAFYEAISDHPLKNLKVTDKKKIMRIIDEYHNDLINVLSPSEPAASV